LRRDIDPTLQNMQVRSTRFSLERSHRLNIVAISCIQLPPYSMRRRHITGNFHPLLCWLVADRLRENYPHKSWRLKSRGVCLVREKEEISNTIADTVRRILRYIASFWRKIRNWIIIFKNLKENKIFMCIFKIILHYKKQRGA